MNIKELINFTVEKAAAYGAKGDNIDYIKRENIGEEALKDNGAYFGLIAPEEERSGPFHDFSIVIFPSAEKGKAWLLTLCIGSYGFKNDYELATYPGMRRLFSQLINDKGFCKSDFSDIETSLPKSILKHEDLQHLSKTIKTYAKYIPVCQIIDNPETTQGQTQIATFIAAYAKLRDWPSNKEHRTAIANALSSIDAHKDKKEDFKELVELLDERKYLILQGAPGTGKTHTAKRLAQELKAITFFTQFHAETSFSDFIYGLRPDVNKEILTYKLHLGPFSLAIEEALKQPQKEVVLIIDEINRANLSNVLGPIFYLFEHKINSTNTEIEIHPNLKINKLPSNLRVIGTMNTADRSLAVVDFALRRRFAWYSLKPQTIPNSKTFFEQDFTQIEAIFTWYASSEELALQPGQGYFIADSDEEMKRRIKYEILPLIKEYLREGLLLSAKEEFNTYFYNRIQTSLFD